MSVKNLQLRKLVKSDSARLAKLGNNRNIWDNLRDRMPFPYTEEDALDFIVQVEKDDPRTTFALVLEGDLLCGVIGLVPQEGNYRHSAELGYWVAEEYWGQGIATKAIDLICDYGFGELGLRRIYAGVYEYNIGSMKALEKNDFQKEGIFIKAVIKNGKVYDEHRYAKINPTGV